MQGSAGQWLGQNTNVARQARVPGTDGTLWLDRPAAVAQSIMGLKRLTGLFFADKFPKDLRETTRAFYRLFYRVDLTEPELDTLIAWSEGQTTCWPRPARRQVANPAGRFSSVWTIV